MMKAYRFSGEEHEIFKIPHYRSVRCEAYEGSYDCENYGTYCVVDGEWDGFVCSHPQAVGNKKGWLSQCPLVKAGKQ